MNKKTPKKEIKKKPKKIINRQKMLQARFINHFIKKPFKIRAARAAGVSRQTVENWLKDVEFKQNFEDAKAEAIEMCEAEMHRRAIEGINKPVIYMGEITDTYKEYSDTLLIFLLKSLAPDRYRERVETQQSGEVILKVQYDDSSPRNPS